MRTRSVVSRRSVFSVLSSLLVLGGAACSSSTGSGASNGGGNANPATITAKTYSIPQTTVTMGIPAFPDNSIYVIGIAKGWYKDVGITIGPGTYGRSVLNTQISQIILTNGVNVTSDFQPRYLAKLNTTQDVKAYNISDQFIGWAVLASPSVHAKSFEDFLASGQNFSEAMRSTLNQITGHEFAVTTDPQTRQNFLQLAYNSAKLQLSNFNVKLLSDPGITEAASGGHAQFAAPQSAGQVVQLRLEGWKTILSPIDIIQHAPASMSGQVSLLVNTVGGLTSQGYYATHRDTLLRLTSVMYRIINAMKTSPNSVLPLLLNYVNQTEGSKLTLAGLEEVFTSQDPQISFQDAAKFLTDSSNPEYYNTVYSEQLKSLESTGTLPKGGNYTPDQLFAPAVSIYKQLVSLKAQAEALMAKLRNAPSSVQALVQEGKKYYDAFDYLDAVGFLTAAKNKE